MVDVEKIHLTKKERQLLCYIEKYKISANDPKIDTPEFKALKSYGMLSECIDAHFPSVPLDEYKNERANVFCVHQNVSRYWIYHKSHFWIEFRKWFTLVIALVGLILSIYNSVTNERQDRQFEQCTSTEVQSSSLSQ